MAPRRKKTKTTEQDPSVVQEIEGEGLDVFQQGQFYEQATDDVQATASCYAHVIDLAKQLGKPKAYKLPSLLESIPDSPPFPIILSGAHNSLAGLYLDSDKLKEAREHFTSALRIWPENSMALVNFANLEHEHGSSDAAWQLMNRVLDIENELLEDEVDPDSAKEWLNDWVIGPHRRCIETAAYMVALHLHQEGKFESGKQMLQRFGFKYRISPATWEAVNATAQASRPLPADPACPVKLYRDAIPRDMLLQLQQTFSPSSPFWEETDYKERPYFSFWYDVRRPASNVVEKLVQDMLPLTGREDIVGAEWWVHSRPLHRNLGHQMHFDTEENTLRQAGEVVHPVWSSVCYLSGAGASPTLVLDQLADADRMADRGWLARPVQGGFLLFPGDRLHGVLPLATRGAEREAAQEGARRLTLMIGFWNKDVVKAGKRHLLGPCGPVPHATRACSWPGTLSEYPARPPPAMADREGMAALGVEELQGVWEEIPEAEDGGDLEVPPGIDTGFFAMEPSAFGRQLRESCEQLG